MAGSYAAVAKIYLDAKGYTETAFDYAEKSLELSKKLKFPPAEFEANLLFIDLALSKSDFDEAIFYATKILNQGISQNNITMKDRGTLELAKLYLLKGELNKVEKLLKENSNILLENPSKSHHFGWSELLWAEFYLHKNNPKRALGFLQKARLKPDLTSPLKYKIELYSVETQYFETIEDFAQAYESKKKYDEQKAYLAEKRNNNAFLLSEQEKNQQEIALLKSQNENEQQKRINQRNILLGGIGLTSIAGIFLFLLYKNHQKTNNKLREIDSLKSNFFTNISHEFRTPLTLISTPIQESLDEPGLTDEKRSHLQIAQNNTKRLSVLIDQLLELSKIDSGSRRLSLEKTHPTQLISAWNESFIYLGKQKNIAFEIAIKNKELEAWCDREALENITTNLLGNAIKYTPEKGKIRLKAAIENKELKLEVANTGKGLNKDQLQTIFNRFYQSNDSNKGAGIGLSLVKELTELHGGKITVKSSLNDWTTFTISLSLDKTKLKNANIIEVENTADDMLPLQEPTFIQEDSNFKKNELPILLIVEDNPDMRTILSNIFRKLYQVVLAENGKEGIVLALEQIPDLIISDLMMPLKDGIELTKTLKNDERTSHIPIILLTAKAGDENKIIGIDVGADDYVVKPFNQKLLKSKAKSLILLRQKLRSRYSQEIVLRPKDIAITNIDEKFLDKVQIVLDEHLIESSFTVEDFSKSVDMSRMQLHRKLKALTGLSASEFIRSQRLKLAARLLKESDGNISQVGYNVGFNDHAYFSKCFKEAYKCTPTIFATRR